MYGKCYARASGPRRVVDGEQSLRGTDYPIRGE